MSLSTQVHKQIRCQSQPYSFIEFWTASVHIIIRNAIFICARSWNYLLHMSSKLTEKYKNKNIKISLAKKSCQKVIDSYFYQSYLNHCSTFIVNFSYRSMLRSPQYCMHINLTLYKVSSCCFMQGDTVKLVYLRQKNPDNSSFPSSFSSSYLISGRSV